MFWKARIKEKSKAPRTLASMIIKQDNSRLIVRFTLDDGEFFDIDSRMPRFHLGEVLHLSIFETISIPTTKTESEVLNEAK